MKIDLDLIEKLEEKAFPLIDGSKDGKTVLLGKNTTKPLWGTGQLVNMTLSKGLTISLLENKDLSQALRPLSREGLENTKFVVSSDKSKIYCESNIQGNLLVSSYDINSKKFFVAKVNDKELEPCFTEDQHLVAYAYYDVFAALARTGFLGTEIKDLTEKVMSNECTLDDARNYSDAFLEEVDKSLSAESELIDVNNFSTLKENVEISKLSPNNDLLPTTIEGTAVTTSRFEYFSVDIKKEKRGDLTDFDFLCSEFAVREVKPEVRDYVKNNGMIITPQLAERVFKISNAIKANRDFVNSLSESERMEVVIPTITGTFIGAPGTSKTTQARLTAAALGLPFYLIPCDPQMDEMGLVASQSLIEGGTKSSYTYTKLVEAARNGGVVLIDEVGIVSNPNVFTTLNNMLSDGFLTIPLEGGGTEVIPVHQECVVIFAGNIGSKMNNQLPESIMSRSKNYDLLEVFEILKAEQLYNLYQKNPTCQKYINELKESGYSEKDIENFNNIIYKVANCFYDYNENLLDGMEKFSFRTSSNDDFITPRDYLELLIPTSLGDLLDGNSDSLSEIIIENCETTERGIGSNHMGSSTYGDFINLLRARLPKY